MKNLNKLEIFIWVIIVNGSICSCVSDMIILSKNNIWNNNFSTKIIINKNNEVYEKYISEPNSFNTFINITTTVPSSSTTSSSSLLEKLQTLPPEFKLMSKNSRNVVIAYSFIFIIGASGNLFVFLSVCRQLGKLKWRMTILIVHLSVADLIVIFCVIPMEIIWRITIQWYGGNLICKLCQFFKSFGLYLSSMILICISLDRFFAILYPLKMFEATRRVKGMLIIAWISATIFSIPQTLVFSVETHPVYSTFQQCVHYGFSQSKSTSQEEVILYYTLFSLSAMYIIPLIVIIFTYSMILWKIVQKSKEHHQAKMERKEINNKINGRNRFYLRSSTDAATMMARARCRTLRLTFIIVLVFILCWTPYAVITLWYMFDRESAKKVDGRIQDGLFMMAVANSCLNPLVYGNYARETQSISTLCCRCGSQKRPNYQLPITSVI